MNSIAFASPPTGRPGNVVRASRSTHSLRSEHNQGSTRHLDGPRSRGLSLTQVLTTTKREANSPEGNNGHSPSTPLVRKSSFWSRKPSPQHLAVPSGSPSLPVVQPASPFRVDFRSTSPDFLGRQRSNRSLQRLSRRHSERASRHSSVAHGEVPALPHTPVTPNKLNKRPSTAGPYPHSLQFSSLPPPRRPTTADSATRFRSRSFFALSSHPVASPSGNVSHPGHPIRRPLNISSLNTRPRSSTNPPLLHRLSVNLFASSPPSSSKNLGKGVASSPVSRSPRPSLSQIPHDILKPRVDECPEIFVNRLASIVSKADIAGVLASSGDTFYVDSLEFFINRFGFRGDPLDVALRRLLMDVGLPRETQQIDRVIEAFANRYLSCNPDLFVSTDHTYILAFSLIMLHTDAFNKSNRRKMSKADYVKNTSLPGMIPEVLDCFYDNIVFAPFIFIEDPSDGNGNVEGNLTRPSTSSGLPSPMVQSGNMLLNRSKIDPYYLITNRLLDQLRVNVEGQIPLENPFRWDGTGTTWDYDEILLAFTKGHVIEIASAEMRLPTAIFGLSVGGLPNPSLNGAGGMPDLPPAPSEIWSLKLTKVAVLNRKDGLLEGGKKPLNRKWRPFSVALTGSQLLLFRDLSWTSTLLSWSDPPKKSPIQWTLFRPDEIISLKHALAVFDRSYNKYLNTFSLTTHDGRHILLQTTDEKEMNEWISCINYASAFKTAGIRMRPLGMSGKDVMLSGVAAATSHLRDLRLINPDQPGILSWDHRNLPAFVDEPPGGGRSHEALSEKMVNGKQTLEMEAPSTPEVDGASQFKETFDMVKAELAAARPSVSNLSAPLDDLRARTEKSFPAEVEPTSLTSRSQMVHACVEDLEARICAANSQINSRMHLARHLGVLAPFQKSTRDRLQDAVQSLSKQIQAMRLDVTKLICHRNVLLNDLAAEERCFKRTTTLALQAATETLRNRCFRDNSRSVVLVQEIHLNGSPQEHTTEPIPHSFDSSVCDSFRSALDFGPDWPSSGEAFPASTFLGPSPSRITDSPTTETCDSSIGCYPFSDETPHLSLSNTNQSLQDTSLHDILHIGQDSSEEQAEEWDKTRAAKRVSLVKLPSSLRLSTIAGKSSRLSQANGMLNEDPSASGRKPPRLPDFRTS
ncbi:hypothetical protein PAXRUDRAFT_141953 [Paxillus rubicundulus Ve08.2h10]|uniref:SEC7 domain-containing protein n=1 Tax=Paxillus rubicundulus Ve08.2h10 TaxID=930991 RepID=A0A0D0DQP7_9AGAM|nr:hypothetical protein PAXRUDRAFT_141953 [Paxillus rubicundulus Ve08.2h10]